MFLLLWGSFLTACSQLVSPLVTFLLGLTCTITDYELDLRAEIRDMRKALSEISMQDEFALYAKTERKINKLTEKLQTCTSARSVQYSKASWAFTISLHSLLGLTVMVTMWSQASTPVLSLPPSGHSPSPGSSRCPQESREPSASLSGWASTPPYGSHCQNSQYST